MDNVLLFFFSVALAILAIVGLIIIYNGGMPIRRRRPHKVRLILKQIINNSIYQIMSITLAANQKIAATFGIVDEVTGGEVTGLFSNQSGSTDNAAVATSSIDASGNLVVTAVAPGTCNVSGSALAAYTNSLGAAKSEQLTTDLIPCTVTAVVTADAVKLVLNFGAPTAQ